MNEFSHATEAAEFTRAGYFEASRGDDAMHLLEKYPNAYLLAAAMGHRARWRPGFNPHDLQFGECFIGDYKKLGMKTERAYRTAKKVLQDGGFATFKTTNRGTIGKLIDARLFKVNPIKNGGQSASHVRTNGEQMTSQVTTNLELRADKRRSDKPYSTKANKLSKAQKETAERFEAALGDEWINDAGKWINRIKGTPSKSHRVIAEVESAMKETRITTTPARYAEHIWKEFK